MERAKAYEVAAAMLMSVSLLKRRIRDGAGEAALTSPELRVLSRLNRDGPATTADLARQEQITPQAMGATVALLEQRGFVARSPDPQHGRRMLLAPTKEGEQALRSGSSAIADRFTDSLLAAFDDEEIEALRAAAPLIERWAEQM
ncbi:MarR family winged helix-turn-helix transcriptional regulator [Actinacidiphila acididurans]|uniref:MarR family transcriptional regulator n=1 Tax=Actinacidiphila acididurans TaxID=2784346 RepID=A0ABS2TTX2_9ACTN|nr:MarR family transcriptional regulator [Actinacidiphila acididurans]MBM9506793.1 MarR family transcriptional regulator [Actinacidiphila acididurans]